MPVQLVYTIIQVTGETSSSLGEGGAIGQITDLCFSTSGVQARTRVVIASINLRLNCVHSLLYSQ